MGGQATVAPTANARHSHPGAVSKASDYVLLAVDDSASRVFGWCDGYAWSSSVTVDPVNIALNQTAQQAAWQGFYYYMEPYGWSGYCDAYSSITTWFVDSCYGYTPYSTSNIDYSRDGQYHNYDFGLPDERTDVYSRAGVQAYDSSFVNWWTYWYASGEFSWLLDEVVGHDYQQGSCY